MDAAGRLIEHITGRQHLLLFTFQLKAVFPFKDVAKNETRMNMRVGEVAPGGKVNSRTVTCQPSRLTGRRSRWYMAFMPDAAGASERSSAARAMLAKPAWRNCRRCFTGPD